MPTMDGNKDDDTSSLVRTGSRVDKLIPKAIKTKRRRRKERDKARDSDLSGQEDDGRSHGTNGRRLVNRESTLDSDDTHSIGNPNLADENDYDDRSFESFSSTTDRSNIEVKRPASGSSPVRPATISQHPSLIGYLTTSSPAVQAAHLTSDADAESANPSSRTDRSADVSPSPSGPLTSAKGTSPAESAILEPPAAAKIAGADRRGRTVTPKLETQPPRTPPRDDNAAPVIVNTPPTPTDHAEATFSGSPNRKGLRNGASPRRSPEIGPAVVNMSVHRRTKSGSAVNSPSKLSNITAAPLTPTDEHIEGQPSTPSFFSSMISAAQNAASSISNTIPTTGLGIGGNKSRSSLNKVASSTAPSHTDVDTEPEQDLPHIDDDRARKESAIRTLGSGDLSLSALGFVEAPGTVITPATARFPDVVDSRTRSESAPAEPRTHEDDAMREESLSRPRSIAEPASGEQTPPQVEYADIKPGVNRSSSLRSAIKPHRKRGSSVTTGVTVNAVAAATGAATAAAASTGVGAPKLTGFAIASKKRNRDFHNLFKSVPDDDYLIEDYSCALQREILAHGRLYVSEGHLCFSSNILGWTTTLVMSFDEIVSVEKRSTALVFKNGLMISTLHAKHIFASFTSRDATYDLIINIWKLGHPTLKSTLNGVQLEGTGGDKTEKIDTEPEANEEDPQEASDSEEDSEGDDDDFYDEEEHDDIAETQSTDMTAVEPEPEKPAARKVSTAVSPNMTAADAPRESTGSPGAADFPGPVTHGPTECGDAPSHYEKVLGDEIIGAPLGKVYTLVFGPSSPNWMSKWLSTDQKCTDIQMDDKKGLTTDNRNRTFTYIKPLNGSIGPKQTKCVVTEMIEQIDLEKSVNLSVSTTTPDVPYGNLFTTKTKYCLSWAENNATRVQINCTVEWSGKCWLKGTIEKNVNEGQGKYCEELFASLKTAVSARGRSGTGTGPGRGKKKLKRSKTQQSTEDLASDKGKAKSKKQNWGLLEPVRGIAEPLVDFVQPVLTPNVMYGLLVGLLVSMWFGFGSNSSGGISPFGPDSARYNPSRAAAYEEMWRREDSELWEWLEERVGIDRLSSNSAPARRKVMDPRTVEEKVREERMDEREVEEAIRVTEEKLQVLKKVVSKD